MQKFQLSEKRYIVIKESEIRLFENGTSKVATFSYPRWALFTEYFGEIDDAVNQLGKNDIKLQLHIGGAWFVSVTTGFWCVDIRKFYLAQDGALKPSRTGLALRLSDWDCLKIFAEQIKEENSEIANAQPCWTSADHMNQEGAMICRECNPFDNWQSLIL